MCRRFGTISSIFLSLMYSLFWVIPRCLNFMCRRFETLFRSVGTKFRRQRITQNKEYNIPVSLGRREKKHKYLPSERRQVNEGDSCVQKVYTITRHQAIHKHWIKIICRIHQNWWTCAWRSRVSDRAGIGLPQRGIHSTGTEPRCLTNSLHGMKMHAGAPTRSSLSNISISNYHRQMHSYIIKSPLY
jgi:hypothetical protein